MILDDPGVLVESEGKPRASGDDPALNGPVVVGAA